MDTHSARLMPRHASEQRPLAYPTMPGRPDMMAKVVAARGQRVLERLAERTAHHLDDPLVGETARATRAQLEKFNPMLMPLLNYLLRNKNRGDERHREAYVSGDVSFVI